MTKIKHLLLLVCIAGCFAACKKSSGDNSDQEAQFSADTTAIRAYVKANNITAIKDNSGIFYQIIAPGTGTVSYLASTKITADYEGKLLNGTIFDTTTGKAPVSFTLGQVIAGWQFGIPLIQKGGKIRLLIPSYYGYGDRAIGAIPANSILDFNITLTDVQ